MVNTGGRLSSIAGGFGGAEPDGVGKASEVSKVGIRSRHCAAHHGHLAAGELRRMGILWTHVLAGCHCGHGGEKVVVIVPHGRGCR